MQILSPEPFTGGAKYFRASAAGSVYSYPPGWLAERGRLHRGGVDPPVVSVQYSQKNNNTGVLYNKYRHHIHGKAPSKPCASFLLLADNFISSIQQRPNSAFCVALVKA